MMAAPTRFSPAMVVYRGLGRAATPFLHLLLAWRQRKSKEDPARRSERYGKASKARPAGTLVWVHAASVGETNAVLPLVERFVADRVAVLLTTATVTSAKIAEKRLPAGAIHQYVPFDVVPAVRRFLDTWQPQAAFFVESELWPATLSELAARAVPVGIVNGRLSRRSWSRWKKRPALAGTVFGLVDRCLAQTDRDAERFRDLGLADVVVTGNLKFDSELLPFDTVAEAELSAVIAGRPVWVAASTHAGEDDAVAAVHETLAPGHPGLLTLLVPRHPRRGAEIAAVLAERGLNVSRRSQGEGITPQTDVYIADTIGELGLFYRLAPVAFVGGSMIPFGGHNPIEPAQLKVALVAGPHLSSFADVYRELDHAGAMASVADGAGLIRAVGHLLDNPEAARDMGEKAEAIVAEGRGALEKTYAALKPCLVHWGEAAK